MQSASLCELIKRTIVATVVVERIAIVSAKPSKPEFLEVFSLGRAYALRACYAIIKFALTATIESWLISENI